MHFVCSSSLEPLHLRVLFSQKITFYLTAAESILCHTSFFAGGYGDFVFHFFLPWKIRMRET